MEIRCFRAEDLPGVMELWNGCVEAGEALYVPLTEAYFRRKFMEGMGCEARNLLVAAEGDRIAGFIHGVAPETFPGGTPGRSYLTVLLVEQGRRGCGLGRALLAELEERMRERGAESLWISSLNPVNLDWRIPGTPDHDHNNMPGLDEDCSGAGFFARTGFEARHREVAMYLDLWEYRAAADLMDRRRRLLEAGIRTGPYDWRLNCEFDGMCDRVGSDYWRDVLRTEIAAWRAGEPNADSRMWPDGVRPAGPRIILAAVHGGSIVGFTGPVDRQISGRGWFTGICTDPLYERRGIATVLFNLLMQEFVAEGARFSTLFTGIDSHARKIYQNAGMRPARTFSIMEKKL